MLEISTEINSNVLTSLFNSSAQTEKPYKIDLSRIVAFCKLTYNLNIGFNFYNLQRFTVSYVLSN